MPTSDRNPTSGGLSKVLVGLLEPGVDFILVGGLAAVIQGAPVTTMDVDIVHSQSPENEVEKRIMKWVQASKQMLIGVHTHRPRFPNDGEPPYFNDGSCVHPRCIIGIEIENGEVSLIKWWVKPMASGTLFVTRELLAGPKKVQSFSRKS
jgi:hypothetical protein